MFHRKLTKPNKTTFLFGPRGTGKSTWIRTHFADARQYDLLDTTEMLRLSKAPGQFATELAALPSESWVVVDEIQKVPALLDEIHRLIEQRHLKFLLSGSSARKLKRGAANLLAGRAQLLHLFSLVSAEVDYRIDPHRVCRYGMLPMAYQAEDPQTYLRAYVETYLKEEITAEALTRNIGGFARFLEVAARQNGQVTNVASIARDAAVSRQTVQGYFDIVKDTLIGDWLPAWKLKRATKQIAHPKFYFFDAGVARALSGRLPYPPTPEELGPLVETFVLQEVQAYLQYSGRHYPLFFWSSHDKVEVDLLCETQRGFVAIEIKGATEWQPRFNKGLLRLQEEFGVAKPLHTFGVYTGTHPAHYESIQVLPLVEFLRQLWQGAIID